MQFSTFNEIVDKIVFLAITNDGTVFIRITLSICHLVLSDLLRRRSRHDHDIFCLIPALRDAPEAYSRV